MLKNSDDSLVVGSFETDVRHQRCSLEQTVRFEDVVVVGPALILITVGSHHAAVGGTMLSRFSHVGESIVGASK
jgi:hypothetical protein